MPWFKKKKEHEIITAVKAKELTMLTLDLREKEKNQAAIAHILNSVKHGCFSSIFEGPTWYEYHSSSDPTMMPILQPKQKVFLETLGYKVKSHMKDVQFRTGTSDGNMKFEIKQYEYFSVSWE